jgi:hypothetical protein
MSGCSTPPKTAEINKQYQIFRNGVWVAYYKMMEGCDILPEDEQAACTQMAREWRDNQLDNMFNGWQDAINKDWDSARERKKNLENQLQEILPNWPDVQNLIDLIVVNGTGSSGGQFRYVMTAPAGQGGSTGGTPIGDPIPIEVETYNFTGQMDIDREGSLDSASCSGTLNMNLSFQGLSVGGSVTAGSFTAAFAGGNEAVITVLKASDNRIVTDESGYGSIIFLASFSHSMNEWDAILPSKVRVYMPVQVLSDGSMVIDSADSQIDEFVNYTPFPYTDYNQDGQWEYNTDMASYLIGHSSWDDLADINRDGVWDQSDIDLWISDFDFDASRVN